MCSLDFKRPTASASPSQLFQEHPIGDFLSGDNHGPSQDGWFPTTSRVSNHFLLKVRTVQRSNLRPKMPVASLLATLQGYACFNRTPERSHARACGYRARLHTFGCSSNTLKLLCLPMGTEGRKLYSVPVDKHATVTSRRSHPAPQQKPNFAPDVPILMPRTSPMYGMDEYCSVARVAEANVSPRPAATRSVLVFMRDPSSWKVTSARVPERHVRLVRNEIS
jgi:hypothetical protein